MKYLRASPVRTLLVAALSGVALLVGAAPNREVPETVIITYHAQRGAAKNGELNIFRRMWTHLKCEVGAPGASFSRVREPIYR
jgi:hypothetical protein